MRSEIQVGVIWWDSEMWVQKECEQDSGKSIVVV